MLQPFQQERQVQFFFLHPVINLHENCRKLVFLRSSLLLLRFQLTNGLKNGSLDLDAHINTHIAESNKP